MSQPNDLDVCRTLLDIIDEMNEDRNQPIEEVEEGKLPAGLQAYQDKKNGKKDADADEDKEVDEDKDDDEETVEEAVEELQKIMQLAGLESIDEAMSDAYGVVSAEDQGVEGGSVEFKQHKNTDKGSVTIEASADNMEELQKIMQLAGLSLPSLNAPDSGEEVEIEPDAEPEEDVIISKDDDDSCACSDCGQDPCACGDPDDAERQQTKQTLVNIIKDKLQQRLK
jgi:hypothetical protein